MIYLNNRRAAHAWISQTTITAGQLHIATKDGEAMVFHDSIDLSPYAGTDAGSTPYRFVFVDSVGKQAVAYGGAVGGGETLGSEIQTDPGFDDAGEWILTGTAQVSGSALTTVGGVGSARSNLSVLLHGRLYKYEGVVTSANGFIVAPYGMGGYLKSLAGNATTTGYATGYCRLYLQGTDATCTSLSTKPLTDIPATGLHLMSAKNGTTRNMTLVETVFNPNTITKIRIYA